MEANIKKIFEKVEDLRSARNQKHPFVSVIEIGLMSTVAGIDSFSGMADFAECHKEELMNIIPLPNGVPSHDTMRRVFDGIDPDAFVMSFMEFSRYLAGSIRGLTAVDGKTIRNSEYNDNPYITNPNDAHAIFQQNSQYLYSVYKNWLSSNLL